MSDLNIIGAGPIGLLSGIKAQQSGLKTIIFSAIGKTAAVSAGGMLAPAYEFMKGDNPEIIKYALASRQLWEQISQKYNINIAPNALALANSEDELEALSKMQQNAISFGLRFDFEALPNGINAKYGLRMSVDGLLNPIETMEILKKAYILSGGEIIQDEIIDFDDGFIFSRENKYSYNKILIANGASAQAFANIIPELSNICGVKGQIIEINIASPIDGSMRYKNTYIMSRNGNTIIGATSKIDDSWGVEDDLSQILFNDAKSIYPQISKAKVINQLAGVRPSTIDELPILGASSHKNIFLSCGAYRNGWLLAPQIAQSVIDEITGSKAVNDEFNINRFCRLKDV